MPDIYKRRPPISPTHPLMREVADIAVRADEQGYRNLCLILTMAVQCSDLPQPVVQRMVNMSVMLVETIRTALLLPRKG